jgi:hypothetical protein
VTGRLSRRQATRARILEAVTEHGAALEDAGRLGSRTGDGLTGAERLALGIAIGILRTIARSLVDG